MKEVGETVQNCFKCIKVRDKTYRTLICSTIVCSNFGKQEQLNNKQPKINNKFLIHSCMS